MGVLELRFGLVTKTRQVVVEFPKSQYFAVTEAGSRLLGGCAQQSCLGGRSPPNASTHLGLVLDWSGVGQVGARVCPRTLAQRLWRGSIVARTHFVRLKINPAVPQICGRVRLRFNVVCEYLGEM